MYVKRTPLGQGGLTFRKRRQRYSPILVIAYIGTLAAALYVLLQWQTLQPLVSNLISPPPAPPIPGKLAFIGEKAYHAGDLPKAIEHYGRAVEADPSNVDYLAAYGRLLTLNHELPEALAIAERIIELAPFDPRGYAVKARALDWSGNYPDAVLAALKAIELDSNYARAHAYLAEAYADLGRLRQAREQAELAIQLDPYEVDARRNYGYVLEFYGDYEGAVQQYLQALQLEPNLLDLWYGLGHNYRGAKRYDEAIAAFQQIASRTPTDPLIYVELGKTYFEIRDDDAAQEHLEHAVELVCSDCPLYDSDAILTDGFFDRPRNLPGKIYMPAWSRLGQVYFTRRNYESALAVLEEAIACGEKNACGQTPDDVPIESYYVTASAYFYLDQCQIAAPRAKQSLDIYLERQPDDPNALRSILCVFTLCRDNADHPFVYQGSGFTNGFPDGYEVPECIIRR